MFNIKIAHIVGGIIAIRKRKQMYIKSCGICDGVTFQKICANGSEKYTATFKCLECGAIGHIKETWEVPKEGESVE